MDDKSEFGRRNLIRNTNIGRGSYTGTNTIIWDATIGKYCCIAWNVSIGSGSHNYNNVSLYNNYWYKRTFGIDLEDERTSTKTFIGNDVWIGAGANILSGVHIGNGSVIGAGAIVTKDVEPYSIVVGMPAKVIKKRFSNEVVMLLEKIKWWDWEEDKIVKNISFLSNNPTLEVLEKYTQG